MPSARQCFYPEVLEFGPGPSRKVAPEAREQNSRRGTNVKGMNAGTHRFRTGHRKGSRSGFTLVELAIVSVILLVAIGGLSGAVISSRQLARVNEETATADSAARRMLEELHGVGFVDIFYAYNDDPDDDEGIPGSAPGTGFEVRGLTPQANDPDGLCGRIIFPSQEVFGVEQLREDLDIPELGLPRDLNGDGDIDGEDHGGDYVMLPVTVRIEWTGVNGNRFVEFSTLLYP